MIPLFKISLSHTSTHLHYLTRLLKNLNYVELYTSLDASTLNHDHKMNIVHLI